MFRGWGTCAPLITLTAPFQSPCPVLFILVASCGATGNKYLV